MKGKRYWGDKKESVSHLSCKVCHKSVSKMLDWSGYVQYVLCPPCRTKLKNKDLKVIEILNWCFYNIALKNFAGYGFKTEEESITACVAELLSDYELNSCVFCHARTVSHFEYISGCNEYYCQKCYNKHKRNVIESEPARYNCGPFLGHEGGR